MAAKMVGEHVYYCGQSYKCTVNACTKNNIMIQADLFGLLQLAIQIGLLG